MILADVVSSLQDSAGILEEEMAKLAGNKKTKDLPGQWFTLYHCFVDLKQLIARMERITHDPR